ncbi:FZO1 [Candida pseudojiufengensis]|uniref:FZO1 n=1 Tax=Candida pseudojiufengensis TaxID=497109 RepID=UPI0022241033|nr:FZO1 [Candida pseudojiufengensis]KAI5965667.1 FZO1 [Candida pseudojiufengensis]
MGDFPFLNGKKLEVQDSKTKHKNNASDDEDLETLIDEALAKSTVDPAHLMYIPGESQFSHDGTTLFDGQEGSSKEQDAKRALALANKKHVNASLQQLHYNENRIALDRSINQTIELINEIIKENKERPVFYPTEIEDDQKILLNSAKAHLALVRQNSSIKQLTKQKIKEDDLVKQLPEFKILKINIKGGHNDENLVSNLDKKSIASLLEKKLSSQIKYLFNLKDRVDDTSSKVFVTGDLNAGKSTFCNALLRRKLLPEDQQPCTSVFCEVIDATIENHGLEEVHAIPIEKEYKIHDESTYEIHPLKDLEELVYDCDKFRLLKVYVLDHRSFQESLLHNGVIDIKLIDAPGLNMDSYQTTQVFSRQEEIDLVIFVVSAENHFTLSAKEFIAAAANEKRYVFIVVNRFDNIKDKEKCKKRILDQIKNLSPDTYKNAKEFIHFVSSNEVNKGNGNGGDDGDGDGDDDNNNNDRNNDHHPNFDLLEASLRKFILEKRSISKLLPAKSYLLNFLHDLQTLSKINENIYNDEKRDKLQELNNQVAPRVNEIVYKSHRIADTINALIESTCTKIYNDTSNELNTVMNNLGEKPVVQYEGLQYLFEYAKESQLAMMDVVCDAVLECEELAKIETVQKVDEIIKYGKTTLNEEFLDDKKFNSELMFTRAKDDIGKNIEDTLEISDFFDPSIESFLVFVGLPEKYVNITKNQINFFNPISVITNIPSNALQLKNQLPTQITLHTIYSSGKILTTGALINRLYHFSHYVTPKMVKTIAVPVLIGISGLTLYYLISDIPNALPRKQAQKIKKQIKDINYIHNNSSRISSECRQVLNYPSRQVMNNFQTSIDKKLTQKTKLESYIKDAELSSGFFKQLLNKINHQQKYLQDIELELVNEVE